jgi:hypothetical protein
MACEMSSEEVGHMCCAAFTADTHVSLDVARNVGVHSDAVCGIEMLAADTHVGPSIDTLACVASDEIGVCSGQNPICQAVEDEREHSDGGSAPALEDDLFAPEAVAEESRSHSQKYRAMCQRAADLSRCEITTEPGVVVYQGRIVSLDELVQVFNDLWSDKNATCMHDLATIITNIRTATTAFFHWVIDGQAELINRVATKYEKKQKFHDACPSGLHEFLTRHVDKLCTDTETSEDIYYHIARSLTTLTANEMADKLEMIASYWCDREYTHLCIKTHLLKVRKGIEHALEKVMQKHLVLSDDNIYEFFGAPNEVANPKRPDKTYQLMLKETSPRHTPITDTDPDECNGCGEFLTYRAVQPFRMEPCKHVICDRCRFGAHRHPNICACCEVYVEQVSIVDAPNY